MRRRIVKATPEVSESLARLQRFRHDRGMRTSACILICLLVSACAGGRDDNVLRVYAAASMTELIAALADDAPARVDPNHASSGALARQIKDGAPADVFISASSRWMNALVSDGLIEGEPVVFARNRLVLIAPPGGATVASSLNDLPANARLAIGDESVPAGEYARQALETAGVTAVRVIGQRDARAVVRAVAAGHVEYGIAFESDAREGVRVLCVLDGALHPPIEYHAGVVKGSRNAAAAREFVSTLQSDGTRGRLKDLGFAAP